MKKQLMLRGDAFAKAIDVDIDELPDIFQVLNDGTGGAIAMDEFITGIMRLQAWLLFFQGVLIQPLCSDLLQPLL